MGGLHCTEKARLQEPTVVFLVKGSSGESTHFLKTPLMVVECPNQLKLLPILYPEILVEKNHGFLGYGGRKVDFFDSRSGV